MIVFMVSDHFQKALFSPYNIIFLFHPSWSKIEKVFRAKTYLLLLNPFLAMSVTVQKLCFLSCLGIKFLRFMKDFSEKP